MSFSFQNLTNSKKTIILIITLLIVISIPLTVVLVMQRQEIRKEAAGEGEVTCLPTGNYFDSNTITIINKRTTTSSHLVQENVCNYTGQAIPLPNGTQCNDKTRDYTVTVPPGGTQIVTMTVPNCKIIQLDVPDCHCKNSDCTETWSGGLGFVLKANNTGYVPGQGCPSPSNTPVPTTPPTPTATGVVTPTVTPTGTRTPTVTPTGTRTPTPTATTAPQAPTNTPKPTSPPGATPTPTPVQPVSGSIGQTIGIILGGGLLILAGLLL